MSAPFQAGDKVRYLGTGYLKAVEGATATVTKVDDYLNVKWDRNELSGGQMDGGYCVSDFELVTPAEPEKPTLKVGDRVRVKATGVETTIERLCSVGECYSVGGYVHYTVDKLELIVEPKPEPLKKGDRVELPGGTQGEVTFVAPGDNGVDVRIDGFEHVNYIPSSSVSKLKKLPEEFVPITGAWYRSDSPRGNGKLFHLSAHGWEIIHAGTPGNPVGLNPGSSLYQGLVELEYYPLREVELPD